MGGVEVVVVVFVVVVNAVISLFVSVSGVSLCLYRLWYHCIVVSVVVSL